MPHPFDDVTIKCQDLRKRLDELEWRPWARPMLDQIHFVFDEINQDIPSNEIEDILEGLFDLMQEHYLLWGMLAEHICPELYADRKLSRKRSQAVPGTKNRIWRMAERVRTGCRLFGETESQILDRQLGLFQSCAGSGKINPWNQND